MYCHFRRSLREKSDDIPRWVSFWKVSKRPKYSCKNNYWDNGLLSVWWPNFRFKNASRIISQRRFSKRRNSKNHTIHCSAAGAQTKVLVCDNNRVNQKFFKDFATVPNKPWLTVDGKFLLFDFVHLIKSLRNNWITEKTKELIFYDDSGNPKVARWAHLEM